MPSTLRHSYCQIMRKLSIQPEESNLDEEGGESEQGATRVVPITHSNLDNNNIEMDVPAHDASEFRKFSVASMSSSKSSSSLDSTCSAPGGIIPPKKLESCELKSMSRKIMTSRPSFISLCSIVSETSENLMQRHLPAPLQVEFDLMQRSGMEGDEPKCRSHLPILRCPSDYDINSMDSAKGTGTGHHGSVGLIHGIKHFPDKFRKLSNDKHRFNVYSISDETREQLKHLYVY